MPTGEVKKAPPSLFAMIGEDEFGTGDIGIKAGLVPAGFVPLVSTNQFKLEQVKPQIERQSATFGKRIYLCRYEIVEVIWHTEHGEASIG